MTLRAPTGTAPALDLARVAEAGLLDVAYCEVDTPVGRVVAARTPRGLAFLGYTDQGGGLDPVLTSLSERLSPRMLESPAQLDDVRRELDEYFEGDRRDFSVDLDLSLCRGPFTRRLLEATARIPFGQTSTYRGMAEAAGNVRAVRAAGNALGSNPIPIIVPCHRVLRTGGDLGGYTGGLDRKVRLLTLEGVLTAELNAEQPG
jgi:methylated-DNA-[protein]-cysteine S-methyltransferase